MAEKVPQTKQNHVRMDPGFHYLLVPGLLLALVWAIVHLVRHPQPTSVLLLLIVVLIFLTAFKARQYAAKVQDRVIRLEERLRLAMLLPESLRQQIPELTEKQLVALRFASDSECPVLVERVLREKLTPKQIKGAIQTWRPDYWRV
jgi:hypothetical protein